MKKKILFLSLTFLAACQSVSSYDKFLSSWIGRSEADLVTTWGAPAYMGNITPERQVFVYIKQKTIVMPADDPNYAILNENSAYDAFGDDLEQAYDYYCKTTFTTQDDIIVNYSWSGDGCLME